MLAEQNSNTDCVNAYHFLSKVSIIVRNHTLDHKKQELKVKEIACTLSIQPRDYIQNGAKSNEDDDENFDDRFCHINRLLTYLLHFHASRISFLPVCSAYYGHDNSTYGDQRVGKQRLFFVNVGKVFTVLFCSFTISNKSVGAQFLESTELIAFCFLVWLTFD